MSRPSFDVSQSFEYYLRKLSNSLIIDWASIFHVPQTANDNKMNTVALSSDSTLTIGLNEALVKFSNQLNDDAVDIYYQIEDCFKCLLIPLALDLHATDRTQKIGTNRVGPSLNSSALLTSNQRVQLELRLASTNKRVCRFEEQFDEHAHYTLAINGATNASSRFVECELTQTQQGTWTLCPIVVLLCLFVLMTLAERVYHTVRRYLCRCASGTHDTRDDGHLSTADSELKMESQDDTDTAITSDEQFVSTPDEQVHRLQSNQGAAASRQQQHINNAARIESLDVFRGLTIGAMIFVNYGGAGYRWLEHSVWDGITVADFVFPFFIFSMGVSIALSSASVRCDNYCPTVWRVLRRSLTMLSLGLCLNSRSAPDGQMSLLRVSGVMQRFAVSYGLVAIVHISSRVVAATISIKNKQQQQQESLLTSQQSGNTNSGAAAADGSSAAAPAAASLANNLTQTRATVRAVLSGVWACARHVTHAIVRDGPELVLALLVLATYIYFTLCFEYDPHCPVGYTGPGGASEHAHYANCTGGAAGWLDRHLLGEQHLYDDRDLARIYATKQRHDPEGLLGITTSIVLTLIGLQCGKQLKQQQLSAIPSSSTTSVHRRRLMSWLRWMLATAIVALISACFVPINKRLWSLSFVTLTGAAAIFTLALIYVLVDMARLGHSRTRPAVLALLSAAGKNSIFLYVAHSMCSKMLPWYFAVDPTSHAALLARLTWSTTLWLLIAYCMSLRRIVITI